MHAGLLFSEHFLVEGIRTTGAYRRLAENDVFVPDLLSRLSEAFGRFPVGGSPDEAQTEQDLIFRIFEALGWHRDAWLVQPRAARTGRSDVPDMLLFANPAAKASALAETEKDRRFRHGAVIVENKRWDRPLDRATKGARKGDIEREVPSSQVLRYLSRAETLSDRRIQWGILSNGRLWRLYYQGARSRLEEYLEIDLSRLVDAPSLSDLLTERDEAMRGHWLRVFALMFGRASFVEQGAGGRTFHLLALDEGRNWEARIARDLSNLVFRGLFPDLVSALDTADPQRPAPRTDAYLRELKEAALTLLYRLLFVLYAEDRDLLPVRDDRYDDYALSPIRNEIAEDIDGRDTLSATISRYYGRLRGLFRAIDKGEPALGLPPYNGGLFDPEAAPLLERVDLPDAAFAPLLDALSRHGGRRINYRDLSVQQLGSIYERLLEHTVVEKDGAVEVVADEAARKGSGSFYTHEVLVQFILERAVGPLVFASYQAFGEKAEALASERRPKLERLADLTALDPASRLLEIKVCDPAMGSGHFLVSLVDFLADRVLEAVAAAPRLVPFVDDAHPYESPLVDRIASIRERILQLAGEGRWKVDEAQLDDRHLVRRMILKRVVHGVDKNPMAVELAKVALWLHTFTAGAPLSFLDHHLRCGDSLLGLRLADIQAWLQQRGALPIHRHVVAAQGAAAGMAQVERITDSDITEVEESEATYEGVREQTEPLAAFLSLIAAERLMGVLDAAPKEEPKESRRSRDHAARVAAWERAKALQDVLDGNLGDPIAIAQGKLSVLSQEPDQPAGLFPSDRPEQAPLFAQSGLDPRHRRLAQDLVDEARALAREHRFLHWELAFPNVWDNWLSRDPAGGFDAVIGNPPYVRQEQIRALKPALRKAYKAFDGVADVYVYFYELGLRLLRPGGRLSYVVTNKWLRAGYAEELRGLLSSEGWLEAVADFGHAKKFFPGADVFPCVIVVRRPDGPDAPAETEVCQIPRDVVRLDRVSQDVSDKAFPLPRASFTQREWQLDPPQVRDLYRKVSTAGQPLATFVGAAPLAGVKTGLNEAYVLTGDERQSLIEDNEPVADLIVPYVKGADLHRWHTKAVESWLILLKSSSDYDWPWSQSPNAEAAFATRYPSVHAHLKPFEARLRARQDQGRYWWELRPCSYYDIMRQDVIYYKDLAYSSDFCVSIPDAIPDMTCFILPSGDPWLLAILNSPLFWGWLWRNTIHGKDETLRLKTIYMRSVPVAEPGSDARAAATSLVGRLVEIEREVLATKRMLIYWYAGQFDIATPSQMLREPFALSAGQLVEAIRKARGARKPLSAAGVQAVREEYAQTVQPMQAALREAERLEWRLSDLVNEAYGLTPDEVRLMWATAPPRMPLVPEPDAPEQDEDEAAE